jgi:hypothetical protein
MIGFVTPSDRARAVWAALVQWLRVQSADEWASCLVAPEPRSWEPRPPAGTLTPSLIAGQLKATLMRYANVVRVDYELAGWTFDVQVEHGLVHVGAVSPDGVLHGLLSLAGLAP